MKLFRKLWSDPVGSGVIGSIIFALLATIAAWLIPVEGQSGVMSWFRTRLSLLVDWTLSPVLVSRWLVGLGLLCMLAVIGLIVVAALALRRPAEASWRSYITDIIYDMRWHWRYVDTGNGQDIRLSAPLCTRCGFQMIAQNGSVYEAIDRVTFYCENCGKTIEREEGWEHFEGLVKRHIQHRLETGAWKNAVAGEDARSG